jgi:hypothetical protein
VTITVRGAGNFASAGSSAFRFNVMIPRFERLEG